MDQRCFSPIISACTPQTCSFPSDLAESKQCSLAVIAGRERKWNDGISETAGADSRAGEAETSQAPGIFGANASGQGRSDDHVWWTNVVYWLLCSHIGEIGGGGKDGSGALFTTARSSDGVGD